MYSAEIEELIEAILADGTITEKERSVLHKRAIAEGIDPDELDVIIEGRLASRKNIGIPPIPESYKATEISHNNIQSADNFKSLKYGSIRKCPNCGALVKTGMVSCSICNYEYVNTEAVDSVKRLSEQIVEIEKRFPVSDEEKKEGMSPRASAIVSVITTFPVPNTREDLLDFIVFTESKFLHMSNSTASDVAIIKAYKAKYIECVERAKIYFNEDAQFQPIFSGFEKNKKRKWRELGPKTRLGIIGICGFIGFYIFIFLLIFIGRAMGW